MRWLAPGSERPERMTVRYTLDPERRAPRAHVDATVVALDAPVRLQTVAIPKPWGQEIWFTGMEARGESRVQLNGTSLPLSAYLALAPGWLHQHQDIVLLKILDPKPEPVLGDLYFEVHERKQETYVVTAVDTGAWPDGVGAIRYGVNQALRTAVADDAEFRQRYLQAVQQYESVRRQLDGDGAPDPALAGASAAELQALEQQRREAMEAFTTLLPLRVGDIVTVPPWHPHSLQHGVQVVEFQSPTYERYIISFAQQVQTQSHWDSARAIERMSLAPLAPAPPVDPQLPGHISRIAQYSDFGALRVALGADHGRYRPDTQLPYAVVICIEGSVRCAGLTLAGGEAAFLPGLGLARGLAVDSEQGLMLIAAPGL